MCEIQATNRSVRSRSALTFDRSARNAAARWESDEDKLFATADQNNNVTLAQPLDSGVSSLNCILIRFPTSERKHVKRKDIIDGDDLELSMKPKSFSIKSWNSIPEFSACSLKFFYAVTSVLAMKQAII